MKHKAFLTLLICVFAVLQPSRSQTVIQDTLATDSQTVEEQAVAAAVQDSLILALQSQLQEMRLQQILMEEALDRAGKSAQLDSIRDAQSRHRIDSLRLITKGAPLVIDKDTLLTLYAKKGGMTAEARVEAAADKIEEIGRQLSLRPDSIYVFDSDFFTDIMAEEEVILTITDTDGLWQNKTRQELAEEYARVIQAKVNELHETYGLKSKLWGFMFALIIIIGQVLCIKLTYKLFRHWRRRFIIAIKRSLKPIVIKGYEFMDTHRQGILLLGAYNIARYLVIILQLFISVPLLFSIFPETKTLTYKLLSYIWNPFKDIIFAVINYLPNLFQIAVIYFCFRYLVRGVRYLAGEIENGNLKINGFYPDWALPTYYILRALLYSLMFVMIWPLLPSSNSEVFQGVSVFIGVIISLGSTSIIGNVMAGMVLTYMRPFHIGDYIKVGDTIGEVIEKTVLVTRIRTRKNEVVTIQNSSLLGSQTSNYSEAAKNFGIIVHTKVTIGYDVSWQLIKQIMESAAADTAGIKKTPKPFMRITALEDFYVEYEINAYTTDSKNMPRIYSELHQNLLQRFFEAGVEIMSPHIYARRDGIDTQMPEEFLKGEKS